MCVYTPCFCALYEGRVREKERHDLTRKKAGNGAFSPVESFYFFSLLSRTHIDDQHTRSPYITLHKISQEKKEVDRISFVLFCSGGNSKYTHKKKLVASQNAFFKAATYKKTTKLLAVESLFFSMIEAKKAEKGARRSRYNQLHKRWLRSLGCKFAFFS